MYQLDPAIKTVWSIRYLVWTFLLSGGLLFFEWQASSESWLAALGFGVPSATFFVMGIILSVVAPIIRFRHWGFELRENELVVQHGFFNRVRTVAPIRRIQHLDVSQNVIESIFDIGKLVIYTAGTRGADIVVPGLLHEYAEDLRDQLKNNSVEDAV